LRRPEFLNQQAPQNDYRLQLSPEIRRMMWELEFERWLTSQRQAGPGVPGQSQVSTPSPDAEPRQTVLPSPAEAAEAAQGNERATPRPVEFPRTLATPEPDVGALMEPFLNRGVPPHARDSNAVMRLYWTNYQWVQLLPEPPAPFSRWIPRDWRRRVAESFTTSAIENSALRFDFPTPTEEFDRQILNMTGNPGTVPSYIRLPAFRF
jgi:hypothetical protein